MTKMNFIMSKRIAPGAVPHIPGTTVCPCVKCGHDLFISPSSFEIKKAKEAEFGEFGFICEVCLKEHMQSMSAEERKELKFAGNCRDQLKEINEVLPGVPTDDFEFLNFMVAKFMGADVCDDTDTTKLSSQP